VSKINNDSTLNRSRDITGGPKYKVAHVTLTMLLSRVICHQYDVDVQKFDHYMYSFSRSKDMVGAHQNLNGSRDLTMAP